MIEATVARRGGTVCSRPRGSRAAVQGGERTADVRDVAEALVGLALTADDPAPALARLDELCERAGIVLTPREKALLPRVNRVARTDPPTICPCSRRLRPRRSCPRAGYFRNAPATRGCRQNRYPVAELRVVLPKGSRK